MEVNHPPSGDQSASVPGGNSTTAVSSSSSSNRRVMIQYREDTSLAIQTMIDRKDVLTLICTLRSRYPDRRIGAALGLMHFARDAERGDSSRLVVRNEIRSSGGFHALLSLFGARSSNERQRLISSMAIGYLLPSLVDWSLSTHLENSIVECISFLVNWHPPGDEYIIDVNGTAIPTSDALESAAYGLCAFWGNCLGPAIDSVASNSNSSETGSERVSHLRNLSMQSIPIIMKIMVQDQGGPTLALMENACAVRIAQPLLVQHGCIKVLLHWLESEDVDKIRTAATSVHYLVQNEDSYTAGWIHTELINQGGLQILKNLSNRAFVYLPLAQIFSSLCATPHTRAAIVEGDCMGFLLELLYHHSERYAEDYVFYALKAIVKVTAGCIANAPSDTCSNAETLLFDDFLSPESSDEMLTFILNTAQFVDIAIDHQNKLRPVAVEALCVMALDACPVRRTRSSLCEGGAGKALAIALREAARDPSLEDPSFPRHDDLSDHYSLVQILRAVANILDAENEQNSTYLTSSPGSYLIRACEEITHFEGLDAILETVSTQLDLCRNVPPSFSGRKTLEVLEVSCKALVPVCPLLLTPRLAQLGKASRCVGIWHAFQATLKQMNTDGNPCEMAPGGLSRIKETILCGLAFLARSYPLQLLIMDRTLELVVKTIKSQEEHSRVSLAALKIIRLLDVANDETARQVTGLNASMIAEWFCLQRSSLLQLLARDEIERVLEVRWGERWTEIFPRFAGRQTHRKELEQLLQQYDDIYGSVAQCIEKNDPEKLPQDYGSLSRQVYPLSCHSMERDFVLDHLAQKTSQKDRPSLHTMTLLDKCFPSKLLREDILPMSSFRPSATFDFRALMMPQRTFLSFDREMQLISRFCEREALTSDSSDVHWTLGFTNSSFGGDFASSLVQLLCLCPTIGGLSFRKDSNKDPHLANADQTEANHSGILAKITSSLPSSLSHLTFDGILKNQDLVDLLEVLKGVGGISAGSIPKAVTAPDACEKRQGNLTFFAIRNSPQILAETWNTLLDLLRRRKPSEQIISLPDPPLESLELLDLSNNNLGDTICAAILKIVLLDNASCHLRALDLSGNEMHACAESIGILRQLPDLNLRNRLCTLRLAANGLSRDGVWLSILECVQRKKLSLETIDLSSNGIAFGENHVGAVNALTKAIVQNGNLIQLNLSCNNFSLDSLTYFFRRLYDSPPGRCSLGFLFFDENENRITSTHCVLLQSFLARNRAKLTNQEKQIESEPCVLAEVEPQEMSHAFDLQRIDEIRQPDNLTVLYSGPLVVFDEENKVHVPMAKLDFDYEREIIWDCLKKASRDIDLTFDNATREQFSATMARNCNFLHFSGHGWPTHLPLEDGVGSTDWFEVGLIQEQAGLSSIKCVFVSACYSESAGRAFVEAGVPHVVCCRQDSALVDSAAIAFTRQFYMALLYGNSVEKAFHQGVSATSTTRNVRDPRAEAEKFQLLGDGLGGGNHNEIIFNSRRVSEWPKLDHAPNSATARQSLLVTKNLIQEYPSPIPPLCFVGREIPMQAVIREIMNRERRLVSITGEKGIGRSSLACAVCHYINQRKNIVFKTIQHIYYVEAKREWGRTGTLLLFKELLRQLPIEDKVDPVEDDQDLDSVLLGICLGLRNLKALIVFDRIDLLDDPTELYGQNFLSLLKELCKKANGIKVLATNTAHLGPDQPPLRECSIRLEPLNLKNSAKLLATLCPRIETRRDRDKFVQSVVSPEERNLLPGENIPEPSRRKFSLLGFGVPMEIEYIAAYRPENVDVLMNMTKNG